jgi:hypothetical protein
MGSYRKERQTHFFKYGYKRIDEEARGDNGLLQIHYNKRCGGTITKLLTYITCRTTSLPYLTNGGTHTLQSPSTSNGTPNETINPTVARLGDFLCKGFIAKSNGAINAGSCYTLYE